MKTSFWDRRSLPKLEKLSLVDLIFTEVPRPDVARGQHEEGARDRQEAEDGQRRPPAGSARAA